jgi:glycosyltransferase involved in cell wall biosynthesis
MALPVVSTEGPGCRDTVIPGETGLLVPPRDVSALVSALRRLTDSDALRAEFGRAARLDACRRFSVETAVDRVTSTYRAALTPA